MGQTALGDLSHKWFAAVLRVRDARNAVETEILLGIGCTVSRLCFWADRFLNALH